MEASLFNLNDSLVKGPEQPPDLTIDAAMRLGVIESVVKHLNDKYVYLEVAEKMGKSIGERHQNGEYNNITSAISFAGMLQAHLREISQDKHIAVNFSYKPLPEESQEQEEDSERKAKFLSELKSRNFGFEKVERLQGNIGYLKLNEFVSPELGGEIAVAAMNFLANTDALIVDLLDNIGGSAAMVALISSYLFDPQLVHLTSIYWRYEDRTDQSWTLPHVPGKRFGKDKDVCVLTSNKTFSAGEEFSYNLQNLKRATIIGEITRGGAHPSDPSGWKRINEHFSIGIPTGRAINPTSKTNWEGTGVKPDVEVPAYQALKTAHLAALKKLLEKTKDDTMSDEIKDSIEIVEKELGELKKAKIEV